MPVVVLPEVIEQKIKVAERKEFNDFTTAKVEIDLCKEIDNAKSGIIKWMFIFSILNVITVLGGVALILKIAKVF